MAFEFKGLTAFSMDEIRRYSSMREIYTSEGQFMNQFIWAGYYDTAYCAQEKYLFYKMKINNEYATMMPMCKKEDVVDSFFEIKSYFNQELHLPLKMYIVDEDFLQIMQSDSRFTDTFTIEEDRSCFDYIYEAEKLRTLKGKLYHKKKNHLNAFVKSYGERSEYRTLCCSNMDEIQAFHLKWLAARTITDRLNCIESEEDGVFRIFQNCSLLDCRMGGIYIDGSLEAYSIGSYDPQLKCAFIHVEKANLEFNGLYNYINQQFLCNEFPEAVLVNREDDLGQEGLRKSKMSYHPLRLEKKFNLFEKSLL